MLQYSRLIAKSFRVIVYAVAISTCNSDCCRLKVAFCRELFCCQAKKSNDFLLDCHDLNFVDCYDNCVGSQRHMCLRSNPNKLSVCRLKLPFNRNLFKISLFNFRIFPHSQEWAFLEILPSEYRLKSLFVLQFNRDRIYHGNFDF